MIHKDNGAIVIECDKCHGTSASLTDNYNEKFFNEGWSFRRTRKAVIHICYNCKSSKQKAATKLMQVKFPIKPKPSEYDNYNQSIEASIHNS